MSTILIDLHEQARQTKRVEILSLMDNQRRTIGAKLNLLYSMAQGRFISCVADDDTVAPDYVASLVDVIERNPGIDAVTFLAEFTWSNSPALCREQPAVTPVKPGPLAAVSAEICRAFTYPDQNCGEDKVFRQFAEDKAGSVVHIDRVLYRPHFRSRKPEFAGQTYAGIPRR